ncbi:PPC domain-containing protein [Marilutibacter maris]|uniref:Peptidase n=1 Tax=Marilutibacter maris TaxID=1605891 RepID=A0A2U9T395_9GAMM|nr:PPC domain-containing protein [Lysobacter maris]AWV05835.1 peptidase domain protein [Lysobacter maris]KAB8162831.1 peptidase [Lysobacter maris]
MHKLTLTAIAAGLMMATTAAHAADPTLTVGRLTNGALTEASRPSDGGGRSQDYTVRLAAGQLVAISAKSDDMDPVLMLFAPDGSRLAENDDRADGDTNALIVASTTEAGEYRVRINSLGSGDSSLGEYTIKASVVSDD